MQEYKRNPKLLDRLIAEIRRNGYRGHLNADALRECLELINNDIYPLCQAAVIGIRIMTHAEKETAAAIDNIDDVPDILRKMESRRKTIMNMATGSLH